MRQTLGMESVDPLHSFGPEIAARYDDHLRGDEDVAADFLAALAIDGRGLEFAIGTGRIALPLAECGVAIDGIELSAAMVDRLRAKPGGDRLRVTVGDMTTVDMGGTYKLVFLVFNTIFNLLTEDDQVRCFESIAGLRLVDRFGSWRREPFSSDSIAHVSVYAR